MQYELRYQLMCSIDGGIDDKITKVVVEAMNDADAIAAANAMLEERHRSSVIPMGPTLYCGERKVAMSNPEYPPLAHRLAFVSATNAFIPD